jgi:hypothetical protein
MNDELEKDLVIIMEQHVNKLVTWLLVNPSLRVQLLGLEQPSTHPLCRQIVDDA